NRAGVRGIRIGVRATELICNSSASVRGPSASVVAPTAFVLLSPASAFAAIATCFTRGRFAEAAPDDRFVAFRHRTRWRKLTGTDVAYACGPSLLLVRGRHNSGRAKSEDFRRLRGAAHALGRSRSAGHLHEQVRTEHAVRTPEGIRGPPRGRR